MTIEKERVGAIGTYTIYRECLEWKVEAYVKQTNQNIYINMYWANYKNNAKIIDK